MAGRGRPRKPSAQRRAEGNASKTPIPDEVVVPTPSKTPAAPAWLSTREANIWKRIAKDLHAAGLLAAVDLDVLAQYCVAADLARRAREQMQKEVAQVGQRGMVKDPAITAWKDAVGAMRQLGDRLGIAPASRSSLGAAGESQAPDEIDPSIGSSPRLRAVDGGKS